MMFKKVHSRIPVAEVNAWDVQTFLGKCGLTRNGRITRAAIILLGKYETALPQNKTHEQQLRMLGDILNAMREENLIIAKGITWHECQI